MDITLKQEDGCLKVYEVKAPWEEIAPRFETVTKTLRSQVRLPGFRQWLATKSLAADDPWDEPSRYPACARAIDEAEAAVVAKIHALDNR